jgi:hypothetical protein
MRTAVAVTLASATGMIERGRNSNSSSSIASNTAAGIRLSLRRTCSIASGIDP